MALSITDTNFAELVENSDKPVVLDFWAEWCGPCRMIAPHIEKMANDYEGRAIIGKVDVDNNYALTAKFGVRNIPTVIFLKGGEISDKAVGNMPLASLVAKLEKLF